MIKLTKVTAVQYQTETLSDWDSYEKKARRLVQAAKEAHAELVLFAEYAGMDLIFGLQASLLEQFNALQNHLDRYINLYQALSREFQIYIQPGTLPVKEKDGFKNRAYFFSPNGDYSFQDKINLIPAELEVGFIIPGNELKIFETRFGNIGIAICYDSEFPTLVYSLVKSGADLILVPSCTESLTGFTRVSICSRARAIENQCFVMQSPLIGHSEHYEFIETNQGCAGIFSPADAGFPHDGILSQGKLNESGIITAELDWNKLTQAREQGQVLNFKDMRRQKIMNCQLVAMK